MVTTTRLFMIPWTFGVTVSRVAMSAKIMVVSTEAFSGPLQAKSCNCEGMQHYGMNVKLINEIKPSLK